MKIWWSLFSYGGLSAELLQCYLNELVAAEQSPEVAFRLDHVRDDALISRSRSVAMSRFLDSDCDVHFQLDHDILWRAGDIVATCRKALERQAVVGGMYSMRSRAEGHAGRFAAEKVVVRPGKDKLIKAEFVGGGFVAYPRTAVAQMLSGASKCLYVDGSPFYDFFRPVVIKSRVFPGFNEFLSEDWSVCERARRSGGALFIWTRPILKHVGEYHYTIAEAARSEAAKPTYAAEE